MAEALLFDLDGVLVDSTATFRRHWYRWASEHGLDGLGTFDVGIGIQTVDHIRAVAPHLDAEDEAARFEQLEVVDTEGIRSIPGAFDILNSLAAYSWAIITSSIRPLAIARLYAARLAVPSVLIAADDVRSGKPAPEGYLSAASRLNVSIRNTVVVEDSPAGIQAGKAAGARVIALTTTYSAESLSAADVILTTLLDVAVRRQDSGLCLEFRC